MGKLTENIVQKYKNNKNLQRFYYTTKQNGKDVIVDGIVNPLYIDNRQLCAPTDQQGDIPMCAGMSIANICESLIWKRTGKLVNLDAQAIYAKAKEIDGTTTDGTTLESAIAAAAELGGFDASKLSIETFFNTRTSDTIEQLKFWLHKYELLHIGFAIDSSWYNCTNDDFTVHGDGQPIGGHAMVAAGYYPAGLIIQNSWGINFGAKGFCICPWSVVLKELIYCAAIKGVFDGI